VIVVLIERYVSRSSSRRRSCSGVMASSVADDRMSLASDSATTKEQ
jgi:hypothetical protein